jgi:hypothetical protein
VLNNELLTKATIILLVAGAVMFTHLETAQTEN